MREILLWMAVLSAAGCSLLTEKGDLGRPRLETGAELCASNRRTSGEKGESSIYVTAVEFSPDYCWQQDTADGNEPFSLVVYRDFEEILRLEGGRGAFLSPDSDMHRFVDGHLYTEYSTTSETVIMKDGAELFRYAGREMLCGFLIRDGDVYSLGQDRSGKGLSFRKNGIPVYSNTAGQVLGAMQHPSRPGGALFEDGGHVMFAYKIVTSSSKKESVSCHLVVDGTAAQVTLDSRVSDIYDIRMSDGVLDILAKMNVQGMDPVLFSGDEVISFARSTSGWQLSSSRLLRSGGKTFIVSDYTYDNWKNFISVLWDTSAKTRREPVETACVYDYYVEGASFAYVTYGGGFVHDIVKSDPEDGKTSVGVQGRYVVMSPGCIMFSGGKVVAGLSPAEKGNHPVVVMDGKVIPLKINGYVTSVSF